MLSCIYVVKIVRWEIVTFMLYYCYLVLTKKEFKFFFSSLFLSLLFLPFLFFFFSLLLSLSIYLFNSFSDVTRLPEIRHACIHHVSSVTCVISKREKCLDEKARKNDFISREEVDARRDASHCLAFRFRVSRARDKVSRNKIKPETRII